jgi:hypothetical protein
MKNTDDFPKRESRYPRYVPIPPAISLIVPALAYSHDPGEERLVAL